MPLDLTVVRLHVYRRFAADAAAATPAGIAAAFGSTEGEALAALRALDDAHLVVLDKAKERIVMAHPWSTDPIGFTVSGAAQKWWGGCAWDSTDRGEVLDLTALWRLATGWYAGRLTPGYRRRTPDEAAAFFASIGLTSDFWRTR